MPEASSSGDLMRGLAALGPSLFSFALSFAVLSVYWVGNAASLARHARVDRPALLLNLLQLFLISLLLSRQGSSADLRTYRPPS